MLAELSPLLIGGKARDILAQLEDKRTEQALPAEMELALLWALQRLGPIEVEPEWFATRSLPEAYTEALFPGHDTVVEIAALSDSSLPGDEGMRNAASKLRECAGSIRKGAGARISFFFFEESFRHAGKYTRRIKVPRWLTVGEDLVAQIRGWLQPVSPAIGAKIRLQRPDLDVELKWHAPTWRGVAIQTTMPAEVHDVEQNHLWRLLKRKADQLRSENFSGVRCLLVADVGSTLLRRLSDNDPLRRRVSGKQIIEEFLSRAGAGLDVVGVF